MSACGSSSGEWTSRPNDSKINKAAPPQSAAVIAAGARTCSLALSPDPECQRGYRTAMAHRARALRAILARAPGDRRAVPHLEPQHGRGPGTYGAARARRPPADAAEK